MADNQHPRTSPPNATISPIGNQHEADPRPRRCLGSLTVRQPAAGL